MKTRISRLLFNHYHKQTEMNLYNFTSLNERQLLTKYHQCTMDFMSNMQEKKKISVVGCAIKKT